MSNIVTCCKCHKKIDKLREESYLLKNKRYAHIDCCKEEELNEGAYIKPIYDKDFIELEKYIIQLFNFEKLPLRIKNQINKWVEEEGYTYTGIQKSLEYWFVFQNNSIESANQSIGIVPWVYENVKKYYFSLYMAEQLNKNKEFKSPDVKNYTVKLEEEKDFIDWEVSDE